MRDLAAGFELFRGGHFHEARALAAELIAANPQDFWAHYLAAIANAFAGDVRAFEPCLAALENLQLPAGAQVYLHYLQAWHALLARDAEKALWHYLQIAEEPEGWLARSLIKKFRKQKEIDHPAFHAADYIVLPQSLPPPAKREQSPIIKAESQGWQYIAPSKNSQNKRKFPRIQLAAFSWRRLFLAAAMTAVIVATVLLAFWFWQKKASLELPPLQVADSAAVMPTTGNNKVLYTYRTRDAIINDFERAKELLAAKKINQSRFLLLRLLESNADFQTREKARIFLGFIPDLPYPEFNDNLPLRELLAMPKLRIGSLVLLSGELRDAQARAGATTYQILARDGEREYLVQVFRDGSVAEEALQSAGKKSHIQVYGRFRGLVGEQKAIYLEALRLWRTP